MNVLAILLVVVASLLVFVLAAVVIGREARRLDAVAPRTVYDQDDAVVFVADRLPAASQARLTPAEVAHGLDPARRVCMRLDLPGRDETPEPGRGSRG